MVAVARSSVACHNLAIVDCCGSVGFVVVEERIAGVVAVGGMTVVVVAAVEDVETGLVEFD